MSAMTPTRPLRPPEPPSPGPPAPRSPAPGRRSGRVRLVAALADEWGCYRTPAGKAVYFMLAFQTAPVPRWRKSSLSLANGNCVEVAAPHPGGVGVRDSTDPAGPVLRFPPGQWRAFLGRLRS